MTAPAVTTSASERARASTQASAQASTQGSAGAGAGRWSAARLAALALVAAVVAGALVAVGGPALLLPVALVVALLGAATNARRPDVLPLAGLAAAATPPLLVLPLSVVVGGKSLFLSDLLLPLAVLVALSRRSRTPRADLAAWAYVGVMALQGAVGVVRSQPFEAFTQDLRGPVYLVCGYFIASRTWSGRSARAVVGVAAAVLWYSALAMVFTIITGVDLLAGRSEEVRAYEAGGAAVLDATRFIVNSKGLAFMAVVAGGLVLLSTWASRHQRTWAWALLVPGFLVSFLSYARATLLALGLCVVLAALLRRRLGVDGRRVAGPLLVVCALVGAMGLSGTSSLVNDAEGNVVARQVAGFQARVLEGLGSEAVESPGNTYRLLENQAAIDSWSRNPLFGGGIGAAFKPRSFGDASLAAFERNPDFGVRFIHNGWLWYLVKTGLVGLLAFLAFLVLPVVRLLRSRLDHRAHPAAAGLALSVLGLLVINVFEPDLHRVGTAPLAGAVVGYATLLLARTSARSGPPVAPAGPAGPRGERDRRPAAGAGTRGATS